MSLINQVLKDLQDNQHYVKPLVLHSPVKSSSYAIKITFGLFIIFSIIIFLFPFKESISRNHDKFSDFQAETKVEPDKELIFRDVTENFTPTLSLTTDEESRKLPMVMVDLNKAKSLNLESNKKNELRENENYKKIKPKKVIVKNRLIKKNLVKKNNEEKLNLPKKVKSYSYVTQLNKKLSEIKLNRQFLGFQKTKQQLTQLIKDNPGYHSARVYLIQLLWQEKDLDINNLLEKSVNSYPNQSIYRLSAARYYLERSQNDLAVKFLTELPNQLSFNRDIIQTRAIIRQKQNEHQLAIDDYKKLATYHSVNGSIYLAMGISFEALGSNQMADKSYRNAIQDSALSLQQKEFLNKKLFKNKQKFLNQKFYDQGK